MVPCCRVPAMKPSKARPLSVDADALPLALLKAPMSDRGITSKRQDSWHSGLGLKMTETHGHRMASCHLASKA